MQSLFRSVSIFAALLALTLNGDDRIIGRTPERYLIHRSEIPFRNVAAAYRPQAMDQWCWAASISMVFRIAGFIVPQERVVLETYGAIENVPAINGTMVARNLNRSWVDDRGRSFNVQLLAVFDADNNSSNISNNFMIENLIANHPLVIGTTNHAMVLTAVNWIELPNGPFVTKVDVVDPWPSRGPRALSAAEFTPVFRNGGQLRFLAAFEISGNPAPQNSSQRGNTPVANGAIAGQAASGAPECQPCQDCEDAYQEAIAAIPSMNDLLAQAVERCKETCISRFGRSPQDCESLCNPNTPLNRRTWEADAGRERARLRREADRARRDCLRNAREESSESELPEAQ